ncbi:MAG: hypothetical protein WBI55_06985 [Eubacteriales bacterium]|jgi:hypothetical protein|nr:hypothetical protein [Clostridiales bacterium]
MNVYIYKAAGAVLLLIGGAILLSQSASDGTQKLARAKEALRLVRYTAESIEYRRATVPEILMGFRTSDELFQNLCRRAAITSLTSALASCGGELFDLGTLSIMEEFAAELGRGYEKSQLELCSITSSRLKERIEVLEKTLPERRRLERTICLFIILTVIIILL